MDRTGSRMGGSAFSCSQRRRFRRVSPNTRVLRVQILCHVSGVLDSVLLTRATKLIPIFYHHPSPMLTHIDTYCWWPTPTKLSPTLDLSSSDMACLSHSLGHLVPCQIVFLLDPRDSPSEIPVDDKYIQRRHGLGLS